MSRPCTRRAPGSFLSSPTGSARTKPGPPPSEVCPSFASPPRVSAPHSAFCILHSAFPTKVCPSFAFPFPGGPRFVAAVRKARPWTVPFVSYRLGPDKAGPPSEVCPSFASPPRVSAPHSAFCIQHSAFATRVCPSFAPVRVWPGAPRAAPPPTAGRLSPVCMQNTPGVPCGRPGASDMQPRTGLKTGRA